MTHDFVKMAARVRLLVDSVAFKGDRLSNVSAGIKENRDQAEAYSKDANFHGKESTRLAHLSEQHRKAASRMIDEEAELKVELKAEEAELEQIREAFDAAGIQLPEPRAVDDELPSVADATAAGVALADAHEPEVAPDAPAYAGRDTSGDEALENTLLGMTADDPDDDDVETIADETGATLSIRTGPMPESVDDDQGEEIARVAVAMGDAQEPTADEMAAKVESFTNRIRGKHEGAGGKHEPADKVISGVHEFTEAEAIAAGQQDAALADQGDEDEDEPEVETISDAESAA